MNSPGTCSSEFSSLISNMFSQLDYSSSKTFVTDFVFGLFQSPAVMKWTWAFLSIGQLIYVLLRIFLGGFNYVKTRKFCFINSREIVTFTRDFARIHTVDKFRFKSTCANFCERAQVCEQICSWTIIFIMSSLFVSFNTFSSPWMYFRCSFYEGITLLIFGMNMKTLYTLEWTIFSLKRVLVVK